MTQSDRNRPKFSKHIKSMGGAQNSDREARRHEEYKVDTRGNRTEYESETSLTQERRSAERGKSEQNRKKEQVARQDKCSGMR